MEEPILKVSLKDYKKQIDDLRASLLSLDSASAEYKSTAEEIRDRQSKLNEVMSVGKSDVDAVAGSYNALNREMIALKKEWKNMEIGTDEWKAMAAQINSLNDQLKDADALTGNFQRNVGDYANAFGAAFDKAAEQLGRMPGPLGTIFKVTKDLLPAIKAANKTATTGLAGVRKAIISTGVGALVVAVGLLVSHWGDFMKLIKGGQGDVDRLKEAEENLNEAFAEQNRQLENETTVLSAQGASVQEVNARKQELIRTQLLAIRTTISETKAAIAQREAHSWLGRVLRGENGELKELRETLKSLEETEKGLTEQSDKLAASTEAANAKAWKESRDEAEKLLRQLEENNKTEIQKLTDKYNEELALLKKHHKSTKALTEQYNKDMQILRAKAAREEMSAQDNLFNANMTGRKEDSRYWAEVKKYYKERQSKIFDIANQVALEVEEKGGSSLSQKDRDKIYEMFTGYGSEAEFIAAGKEVMEKVRTATNNMTNELIKEEALKGYSHTAISGTFNEVRQELDNLKIQYEAIKKYGQLEGETAKEFNDRLTEAFENVVNAEKAVAQFKDTTVEFSMAYAGFTGKLATGWSSTELTSNLATAQIELANYLEVMRTYVNNVDSDWADAIKQYKEGSDEWVQAIIDNLQFFPEDARSTFLQKLMDVKNAEKDIIDERIDNWFSLANSVADINGSIADMMDSSIERRKQELMAEGKTEEEANKMLEGRFEAMKGFQIAQAVINTIAGAIGAFMGITRDTGGWGIAAAAAEAAAITAAGIAQIEKIRNTSIGKTESLDSSTVSVTPTLADYTPERTANITSASDTDNLANALSKQPVYVKVSDIDRAQKKVQVRQGESRF